ncbi:YfhO family protein [Lentilactobacillus kosonis]|nr:YfhO family protein [Lentilactobacillus kosonis]
MITNKLSEKKTFYLMAIIIPMVVLTTIFLILQISPFGPKNFMISDLSTQYLQFFTELRRQLLHLHFSSYSFLVSIGDSVVPIYSYYLLSPFNLIIVFFKNAQLPMAIDLIIWLKLIFANFSMSVFLAKKYQKYDLMAIAAGVAYGLCGFAAMYFYDLMWLDALIMLPIVVYGLEKLVSNNRVWLYVLALTYTIVTNYYMGYMMCIFMVMYLGYLLINEKPDGIKFSKFIATKKQLIGRFSWYSLLAGGLSAVVLIPTGIAMMTTGKGSFALKNFLPIVCFGPSALTNLGVGANNFNDRLFHDPSFFSGTVFIIGLIGYFLSKQINKQSKRAAGFILTTVILGMWILPFNTIWHMLQQPAGFPFRMVFMLSFLIIMFGFEAYTKNVFTNRKVVFTATKYVGISIVIGYIGANIFSELLHNFGFNNIKYSVNNWHLLVGFGFILVTSLLMMGIPSQSRIKKYLLCLTVVLEMGINFVLASGGATFINQNDYAKAYTYSERIIKRDNANSIADGRVYRSLVVNQPIRSLYVNPYSGYNDSLIFQIGVLVRIAQR